MDLAGRPLTIETGKLAKQAGGAVLVRYGDTAVLVTATASAAPREGIDFFPLTVDVEERTYAVGRIPGGIFRREGRPTEKAILEARLTDRPIRPLFPEGFRNDVQIVATIMSVDHDHSPEICAMLGASCALTISDVPFGGPIGAVMVGIVDGEYVLNPTNEQSQKSVLHLTVAGTKDAILMVEAGAKEVSEKDVLGAILFGHEKIKEIVALQEEMQREIGKPKRQMAVFKASPEVDQAARAAATAELRRAAQNPDKLAREKDTQETMARFIEQLSEQFPDRQKEISSVLGKILKEQVRDMIVNQGTRPDGRRHDEIRPITCEVGLLPRAHGSGLFTRGQTQVMTATTLGTVSDVQKLIDLSPEEFKRYMHHYNFPPYSVGETRPLRGPGRREIGHGALAERALEPLIPGEDEFPYAIRLVSEVLESNGSTSMASVCASTLSLMDAGVPLKAPVAGVAMGLVQYDGKVAVLTDIQGIEDALGDMDFKVAGTHTGVTAIQMDMKIAGINRDILERALEQARQGRLFILDKIHGTIAEPRPELSPFAPRIIVMQIDPDKIREVIGPGGKTINKIIADTGVEIDIEDDGRVYIASTNMESGHKAAKIIENLIKEVEVGTTYLGKVMRVVDFGAFVEILPGKEGLVRIGELAEGHVDRVEDVVNVGDEIMVKVIEIDRLGRINLSRRELLPGASPRSERETSDRGGRGGPDRGRGGGPGRPGPRGYDHDDRRRR
ncbi:MAG TPA: polyribonucleotide nucleotidyltransferase [Bacillota bacterium]|jgi:polyribonucleotide nucleotidyltransferase